MNGSAFAHVVALVVFTASLEACSKASTCTDCPKMATTASIDGDVMPFLGEVEGARVAGATISVVEHPGMSTTSDANGHFHFDGLDVGSKVTLHFEDPDFHTMSTATVFVGANGIDPFPIQPVPNTLYTALKTIIKTPVDDTNDCIIATTVTRLGGTLYAELRQGEAGVTVSISPPVPAGSGPIYFNESVLPDPTQAATSTDGGVVFINVPPGDYVLSGSKPGLAFSSMEIRCVAGEVENGGPPLGIDAHVVAPDFGAGVDRAPDAYSNASDALCAATATCVNAKANATNYPDATVASCKRGFDDMWASIDPRCDPKATLRDAGKALYACRAASCDVTLGGDTACAAEDAAWNTAMDEYGACYAAWHASP